MNVCVIYQGDFQDENIQQEITTLKSHLSKLIGSSCVVTNVEPWNSVKVTFSIPREAANKLKLMAMSNSSQLNQLGILSVQVEGENIIKLSFADADGSTQQVVLQQQQSERILPQGNNMHVMDQSFHITTDHPAPVDVSKSSVLPTPPSGPKKRSRKPKDKQPSKAAKTTNPNTAQMRVPQSPMHPDPRPHFMTQNSTPGPNGQYHPAMQHSQLSPSVEQFVSDAWEQQMQQQPQVPHPQHPQAPQPSVTPAQNNPEEDIMDVQLQSLLSGHNVTTGHNTTSSNFSDSFESQQAGFSAMPPSAAMFSTENAHATKAQAAAHNANLMPEQLTPGGSRPLSNSSIAIQPSNATTHSHIQPASIPIQQQMISGGMAPSATNHITRPTLVNNSNGGFPMQNTISMPAGSVVEMNQKRNMTSPQAQWPNPGMLQRPNSQGAIYKAQIPNPNQQQPVFHQQPGMVPAPNPAMQHKMASATSANQTQFPFSFNNQPMKPGEMPQQQQQPEKGGPPGMSMASPLLVNLLQTEASGGIPEMANQQPPIMGQAPGAPKPKKKKPTRKRKANKTPATELPSPGGPMPFPGMYTTPDGVPQGQQQPPMMDAAGNQQFMNQRFPHFKMQAPPNQGQQVMQQQQGMNPNIQGMNPMPNMNYPDNKASVIETISRSDVGGQGVTFSGNVVRASGAEAMPQGPVFQRQGSVRAMGHGFPPGFDPNKAIMFQQNQMGGQPTHQHMYINQMAGNQQFAQFDQNQQRTMSMQQPHPHMQPQMMHPVKGQPPYGMNPGQAQFQGAMGGQGMPQNAGGHFHMGGDASMHGNMMNPVYADGGMQMQPNLNNSNNRVGGTANPNLPQTSAIMGGFKSDGVLPTLPPGPGNMLQYQTGKHGQTQSAVHRRATTVGRLPSGALSIVMKRSCAFTDSEQSPTAPNLQLNRPSSRSSMHAKKSPGSSFDANQFGIPSPKMAAHGLPSPRLQSPLLRSPSPHGSHGSRSGTPKPRTPGAVPRNPIKQSPAAPRRPSLDQYMSPNVGPTRGFASAPATPTNMPPGPVAQPHHQPPNFNYQPAHREQITFPPKGVEQPQFYMHDPLRPNYWPQYPLSKAGQPQQWQGEYQPPLQTYPNPYPPQKSFQDMSHPQLSQPRAPFDPNSSSGMHGAKSPRADLDKVHVPSPVGGKVNPTVAQTAGGSAAEEHK